MDDVIKFGEYNGQPLTWRKTYKNENEYILDGFICKMPFDKHCHVYKDSDVRRFLLDDFLPTAFSNYELMRLSEDANPFNDKVYLFSFKKYKKQRRNLCKGIFRQKGSWWLFEHTESAQESTWGVFARFGFYGEMNISYPCGVRPCITIID